MTEKYKVVHTQMTYDLYYIIPENDWDDRMQDDEVWKQVVETYKVHDIGQTPSDETVQSVQEMSLVDAFQYIDKNSATNFYNLDDEEALKYRISTHTDLKDIDLG